MDSENTFVQHLIVGTFSLGLVLIFKFLLDVEWTLAFARVSFILLFLILIIGPITRLKRPTECASPIFAPWSWRGEIGIWFAITGITHFIILLMSRPLSDMIKIGGSGYGLANLLGLIALFLAILLTITSFKRVIVFIGMDLWKWLHGLTHTVFYLVVGHLAYFQFFSTYNEGPHTDWFGYLAVALALIVIALQIITFIFMITKHRDEVCSPPKQKTMNDEKAKAKA